eukprot:2204616-Rhodomonas_salina.2
MIFQARAPFLVQAWAGSLVPRHATLGPRRESRPLQVLVPSPPCPPTLSPGRSSPPPGGRILLLSSSGEMRPFRLLPPLAGHCHRAHPASASSTPIRPPTPDICISSPNANA